MDERQFEMQKELNAQMMGFAHGYVQGLVVVAYAGFFFLWDSAKDLMSPGFWALAGLLTGVSLLFYTAWEIFAFFFRQSIAMKQAARLEIFARDAKLDRAKASAEWLEAGQGAIDELAQFLPKLRRMWHPAMIAIVVPLAASWLIVTGGYAIRLLRTISSWA